jgi:nicotinamide mononucleotide (NMN) deamidase PncC
MTEFNAHALATRIHASGRRCVVALTGGGSQAIADLLAVPGASATMLEAIVPYAQTALEDWLGGHVDHACSEATARAMAMASFERARLLSDVDAGALRGISATASLASVQPKRGDHRVHIAWQSSTTTVALSCTFVKGRRTRGEEETLAGRLVLGAVAEACGAVANAPFEPSADQPIERREKVAPAEWTELLLGQRHNVAATASTPSRPQVIFPGAFRPLHVGHERMAEIAARRLGAPVTFELSITNVDKPTLDFLEIDDRLRQFANQPVQLTRAATFAEKAAVFPGATFVVGADTIERLADTRYYGDSHERRDAALAAIGTRGCRFLVFGRVVEQRFQTLEYLSLPSALRGLCDEVPPAEFREDISSTELRMEP